MERVGVFFLKLFMNKLWILVKRDISPKGGQTAVQAVLYYIQGSILDSRDKSFQQMAAKCCILIKSKYHDIL